MLTPIFSITQDIEYVYINIKAPNAKITETEIEFEDTDFRFYSKPYYLRLTLPSKLIQNGEEMTEYDSKKGTFLIKISKLNKGEHFEGLDLLTKLIANNKQIKKPLIEVIGEQQNNPIESIDEDFDWTFEQTLRHESDDLLLIGEKYGFANEQSGVIARVIEEYYDLIDIKDPEHKNWTQRRQERLERETIDFSDEHYLFDLFEQKLIISNLISMDVFCMDGCVLLENSYKFNDDEKYRMKNMTKREYIFDKSVNKTLLLGVIDILFAYAYDMRVNECEHSVESGWNVCKLSSTLSWFDSFTSIKEVLMASIRRSLCYPLYRSWELSLQVVNDVIKILKLGQNYVLKCFLDIHKLFNESGDGRYILNDLYITDYCVWLQYLKPKTFESLSTALEVIQINKTDISLDLEVLEMAANLAIQELNGSQINPNISQRSGEQIHQTSSETIKTSLSSKSSPKLGEEKNTIDSDDDISSSNDQNLSDSNDSNDELSSSHSGLVSSNVEISDKSLTNQSLR